MRKCERKEMQSITFVRDSQRNEAKAESNTQARVYSHVSATKIERLPLALPAQGALALVMKKRTAFSKGKNDS